MSINCCIDLENNPMRVVYAGQLLRGTVRLKLMDKTTVSSIYIRISGKVFAQWKVGNSVVTAKEDCLDERIQLVGDTFASVKLEPGDYNHTFEFPIPTDVPSSIEGSFGHIRYTVQVVVDVPLWLNKKFKDTITVVNAINLNDDLSLRRPFFVDESKKILLLCFPIGSNVLKIFARTPLGGFVPTDTISVEINVYNNSNLTISKLTVELIKLITYLKEITSCGCKNKQKKLEHDSLFKITGEGCGPHQGNTISASLTVPITPPTDSSMCKTMKLTYLVRITASMPFFYANPIIDLPITIGSYPFHDETPARNYYF